MKQILISEESRLGAIGPIDGRYGNKVEELQRFTSEYALISYRLKIEILYLIAIAKELELPFTEHEQKELVFRYIDNFTVADALEIKNIEKRTNHDLNAVVEFLTLKVKEKVCDKKVISHVHFGLTSWDIDNLARTLMLLDGEQILYDELGMLESKISDFVSSCAESPMLARTHGQPASPTTFGKEMEVFRERLVIQMNSLHKYKLSVKFGGATGNMNAHYVAYPDINWITFAEKFIQSFGTTRIYRSRVTTQINAYDSHAEYFGIYKRINTILIDFSNDIWRYISDGWINQKAKEGEVGSSAMPHKVNPIDFENAEGNFGLANAQLEFYERKLPISRLQRDLSDSTVVRNFGMTLAYCLLGYQSLVKGLGKIEPNTGKMLKVLQETPEVVTEALKAILCREGVPGAYDLLKKISRGKEVTYEILEEFIKNAEVSDEVREELAQIKPENYIGYAIEIVGG